MTIITLQKASMLTIFLLTAGLTYTSHARGNYWGVNFQLKKIAKTGISRSPGHSTASATIRRERIWYCLLKILILGKLSNAYFGCKPTISQPCELYL